MKAFPELEVEIYFDSTDCQAEKYKEGVFFSPFHPCSLSGKSCIIAGPSRVAQVLIKHQKNGRIKPQFPQKANIKSDQLVLNKAWRTPTRRKKFHFCRF